MIKQPPFLQNGDVIGIVASSGFMPFEKMESCIETLKSWGYTVQLGATTQSLSENYFSGTDEERLTDLQKMLDDKNINAILFARGGYGLSRIVDQLHFKKFKKNPKWLIGFSDITVLHTHIFSQFKIATLHAPMAAAFNEGGSTNEYVLSLKKALEGKPLDYASTGSVYNHTGKAKGILVGGNLALLAHVIGSPSDIETKNKILFLEDVGEYLYNIDRMLMQLKRSGKLDKLAGLVLGSFTDCKDTQRAFGKSVEEILNEQVKRYKYPIGFNFPVGHGKENMALKIGVEYELTVTTESVRLKEKVK